MTRIGLAVLALVLVLAGGRAWAVDHVLAPLEEPAPADAVAPELLDELNPTGVKVLRGRRTLCDLWFCKSWAGKADFEATSTVIYPFEVGQLMAVVRYKSKGTDFRGQDIPAGVYVVRYAQQPVDGNHVGTSDTLDFLLLTPAADDRALAAAEGKELFKLSAKVAGSKHPTMLCLVRPFAPHDAGPTLRHDEERDFWIVQTAARLGGGDTMQPLELVIVGQSAH
jgi:hypothetical protein